MQHVQHTVLDYMNTLCGPKRFLWPQDTQYNIFRQ